MSAPLPARRLVVDADIVAAATAHVNPRSVQCTTLLATILATRHVVTLPPFLREEWERRFPRASHIWLTAMYARRLVHEPELNPNRGVAGALARLPFHPDIVAIVVKDAHLLEAALATDRIVLSMDETAYYHFCDAAATLSQIRPVMWANPERAADDCITWLTTGAKPETKRRIGRRPRK